MADRESFHLIRETTLCPDAVWYRNILCRDAMAARLSEADRNTLIALAQNASASEAERIRAAYGLIAPESLACLLGARIERSQEDLGGNILFGLYEPKNCVIRINQFLIERVKEKILAWNIGEYVSPEHLEAVILFHELFHLLEDRNPHIPTQNMEIPHRVFRLFPVSHCIRAPSEIGAIHFSKLMSGLSYSPCVYENVLLL